MTVGVAEDVALAPWRHQSVIIAIGALGAVIGFGFLFRALAVQFHRLEQGTSELTRSEDRFRDFAMTSSDWLLGNRRGSSIHLHVRRGGNVWIFHRTLLRDGHTRLELDADAGRHGVKWEADHRPAGTPRTVP